MISMAKGIGAMIVLLSSGSALSQAERCGLSFVDEAQMLVRVEKMDANADGLVTRDEREAFLATLVLDDDIRRRYVATFDLRDTDGNNVLAEDKLRAGIGAPLADL